MNASLDVFLTHGRWLLWAMAEPPPLSRRRRREDPTIPELQQTIRELEERHSVTLENSQAKLEQQRKDYEDRLASEESNWNETLRETEEKHHEQDARREVVEQQRLQDNEALQKQTADLHQQVQSLMAINQQNTVGITRLHEELRRAHMELGMGKEQ
jgi:SMC interacting uncharacterized protein involved in chromosome segregation